MIKKKSFHSVFTANTEQLLTPQWSTVCFNSSVSSVFACSFTYCIMFPLLSNKTIMLYVFVCFGGIDIIKPISAKCLIVG